LGDTAFLFSQWLRDGGHHSGLHSNAVYWDLSTKKPVRYRDAGVNIDEADRAVSSIKKFARQTFTAGVLTEIGSFGSMYQLAGDRKPVLGSSGDGVGTKLKVAVLTGNAGAGEFRRRGRHEVEGGVPDGAARHGGRRSGQPLRQRHRGAGGDAAVLPGLLRGGQAGCGGGGSGGRRDRARV